MQTPVGFKGRYFRLTAIAALSGALRSVAEAQRVRAFRQRMAAEREGECAEDPPPDEADLYTLVTHRFAQKACHCNCFFRRKFRRLWHLYKFFFTPPGRYVKTKSGTSPPFFLR